MNPPIKKKPLVIEHRPDYIISFVVISLFIVGLIMIYSTGWITVLKQTSGSSDANNFFNKQLLSFVLGIIGWVFASRVHYSFWQKHASKIFYFSVALMFLVLVPGLGVKTNGATRWVDIGPVNFQPVEFYKLGLILFVSAWIEKNRNNLNKPIEGLLPILIMIGISAFLAVILQKDMGSASIIVASIMSIYFVSGVSLKIFGAAMGIILVSAVGLVASSRYRLARYITFLNNSEDVTGAGYHINQSLIALGSGGIFGKGLGKSVQAYGYLPEATNDSIFAIIGEEFGFAGATAIVAAYSLFLYRGYLIIRDSPDNFAKMVATGIVAWIGFQAFFNISAMLGIIPLTGITLPFVSYGGTSIIALLIAVGILQNISRYTKGEQLDENRGLRRRNSRSHYTSSSSSRRPT